MRRLSQNWNADSLDGYGVADACGDSDGDSVTVGVADAATVAVGVGDDAGDARDGLARRKLEIRVS